MTQYHDGHIVTTTNLQNMSHCHMNNSVHNMQTRKNLALEHQNAHVGTHMYDITIINIWFKDGCISPKELTFHDC